MPRIIFNAIDDQPVMNKLALNLFPPYSVGSVFPLAFRFDLPDGGSRLDGSTRYRTLWITTTQTRVTPKLIETVAARAAAIVDVLYDKEVHPMPALLVRQLQQLLERDVRLGAPDRDFSLTRYLSGWGYSTRGSGGTTSDMPLQDHLDLSL